MDEKFIKIESMVSFLLDFEKEFNDFIPNMKSLINNIPTVYHAKYVDLFFNLYSSICDLCQTRLNLDTLKDKYDKVILDYSQYMKFINLLVCKTSNSSHFNSLKNKYDDIVEICS